jgi:hypothetical protein
MQEKQHNTNVYFAFIFHLQFFSYLIKEVVSDVVKSPSKNDLLREKSASLVHLVCENDSANSVPQDSFKISEKGKTGSLNSMVLIFIRCTGWLYFFIWIKILDVIFLFVQTLLN